MAETSNSSVMRSQPNAFYFSPSPMSDVKPLAPASRRISVDDDSLPPELPHFLCNRGYIKCCGCASAFLLILAVTAIVLAFTVFQVKDPKMKLKSVQIPGLDLVKISSMNSTAIAAQNLTVVAGISVKNPNVASFKYSNATTDIYYDGVAVGEARSPPGIAKARRTLVMNVTVVVNLGKFLGVPRFTSDFSTRSFPMSCQTVVHGRVKILGTKKNVEVRMSCNMTINATSQAVEDQKCFNRIRL
ncbi:hypothetical protein NMG60_11027031 [Bertholletia excelsa]